MKKLSILVIVALLAISCNSDTPFLINDSQIGPILKTTTVGELETLFINDSVINKNSSNPIKKAKTSITVFEKGGKKLMSILPTEAGSESAIKNVKIYDERYKTDRGIGLSSTFKDLSSKYTIKRIDNLIDVVVVFVEESNAYFTIDKKHLAGELMFNTRAKIEKTQIPDNTPIKYFMIEW